jgi:predicted RNA-binding protein with RPS1 domain
MTDHDILTLITQEFKFKSLELTRQYLEIHEPVYENGTIKISRIDRENIKRTVAYVPVKDEYFSFAIYIDEKEKEIISLSTESRNLVSLVIASETMLSSELMSFTSLKCQEHWNKGDKKPNSKAVYSYSALEFYLNLESDEFEDKLNKLLNHIETDKSGIKMLATKANAYITALIDFHKGNQFLGGFTLDLKTIKRLSDLNLSIDFQVTAWGNSFK